MYKMFATQKKKESFQNPNRKQKFHAFFQSKFELKNKPEDV